MSKLDKKSNIFEQLKSEHEELLDIFEEATNADEEDREEALHSIEQHLIPHARGEEKSIYALLRKKAQNEKEEDALNLANEAYAEHKAVDILMEKLKNTNVDDEKWLARLTVIKENIEHHIEEEENELFEHAKSLLSKSEISQLLDVYLVEKEKFKKSMPTQSQIQERSLSDEGKKLAS